MAGGGMLRVGESTAVLAACPHPSLARCARERRPPPLAGEGRNLRISRGSSPQAARTLPSPALRGGGGHPERSEGWPEEGCCASENLPPYWRPAPTRRSLAALASADLP